jgi:hypothetical protein
VNLKSEHEQKKGFLKSRFLYLVVRLKGSQNVQTPIAKQDEKGYEGHISRVARLEQCLFIRS